jgi:hypothetical protein
MGSLYSQVVTMGQILTFTDLWILIFEKRLMMHIASSMGIRI